MVSADRARTSTSPGDKILQSDGNENNGKEINEIITDKNNENNEVSRSSEEDKNIRAENEVEKKTENSSVSSYYFPTTDSPLWLCIYKI